MTSADPVSLGSYRGFAMSLFFDSFDKEFKVSMQGALTYVTPLGTDVYGNILRMDNLLESLPTRQADCTEKLENTKA